MKAICKLDYEQAKEYANAIVSGVVGKKKYDDVFFRVRCDDTNLADTIQLVKANQKFICVDYNGMEEFEGYVNLTEDVGVLIIRVFEYGNNITETDVQELLDSTPSGVTPVIKMPEDFKDLHLVWKFSRKFPKVRFCGGNLFSLDGCRLGCCGKELFMSLNVKEKNFELDKVGCSCYFDVYDIDEIKLKISKKKAKRNVKAKSSANKNKSKKPKISFVDLMAGHTLSI